MTSKSMEISSRAFTKLQLHLAKYPHCAANGLLLGCQDRLKEDKVIQIVDVIPLFHQCLQLTPMLEIALTHVDAHCSINHLFIAGYYEAQESLTASLEPTLFATRVCDKIQQNYGETRLVVVDNKKVPNINSLNFYEKNAEGKWKPSKTSVQFDAECEEITEDLLSKRVHRDITDFDNHLDDISQHWLNQPINQLIIQ